MTNHARYNYEHRQLRERWRPHVEAGEVLCHAKECVMPSRVILPGQRWDLGHNEAGTEWTGPEHERCNRRDGAVRLGRMKRERPRPLPRRWRP